MAVLAELVRNLVVVIFINMLLEMLLPHGQFQRYIRLITGLIVILLVINTFNTLLGRPFRAGDVIDVMAVPEPAADRETRGMELWRHNQTSALAVYRDSLRELLRSEIESDGRWVLRDAIFELEEDPDKDTFGAIYRVGVTVEASDGGTGGGIEPVTIEPVVIGSRMQEQEEDIHLERVPELEQALARLLHLDPAVVTVLANKR